MVGLVCADGLAQPAGDVGAVKDGGAVLRQWDVVESQRRSLGQARRKVLEPSQLLVGDREVDVLVAAIEEHQASNGCGASSGACSEERAVVCNSKSDGGAQEERRLQRFRPCNGEWERRVQPTLRDAATAIF